MKGTCVVLVLLAGLTVACETPPVEEFRPETSFTSGRGHDKASKDKKNSETKDADEAKPAPKPSSEPTQTSATPTLPEEPAPPPVEEEPPPVEEEPLPEEEDLVELGCCLGTEFLSCVVPNGLTCGDADIDFDCLFDPELDDLCF